mmetsp:Transcript_65372/g.206564  ORF Transcript_65372/g.206564 Transcript_65372/m.206564 type:complete len:239 (-) Transcript_65372:1452-2168(-)
MRGGGRPDRADALGQEREPSQRRAGRGGVDGPAGGGAPPPGGPPARGRERHGAGHGGARDGRTGRGGPRPRYRRAAGGRGIARAQWGPHGAAGPLAAPAQRPVPNDWLGGRRALRRRRQGGSPPGGQGARFHGGGRGGACFTSGVLHEAGARPGRRVRARARSGGGSAGGAGGDKRAGTGGSGGEPQRREPVRAAVGAGRAFAGGARGLLPRRRHPRGRSGRVGPEPRGHGRDVGQDG